MYFNPYSAIGNIEFWFIHFSFQQRSVPPLPYIANTSQIASTQTTPKSNFSLLNLLYWSLLKGSNALYSFQGLCYVPAYYLMRIRIGIKANIQMFIRFDFPIRNVAYPQLIGHYRYKILYQIRILPQPMIRIGGLYSSLSFSYQ